MRGRRRTGTVGRSPWSAGLAAVGLLGFVAPSTAVSSVTAAATTADAAATDVAIDVLSTRADLVSGGDALVEVTVPDGADPSALTVQVDGRDVTGVFAVREDGRYLGVLEGLALGDNVVVARLPDGRGARLTVTNHPIGGPVFSGPHIEPWSCAEGAQDEDCNREPTYDFFYRSSDPTRRGLQPYDPEDPPDDVAETTTDEGKTVPFIVRRETGVLARDEYKIAVLFDPEQPWSPTDPQEQWNRKLLLTHGASCDTSYAQGEAPSVFNDIGGTSSPTEALSRGFAVASHALDNAGHNCNLLTQAESLVMTKEYLVDHYGGPIRYTIGTGCSGGSLVQHQVANAYPGVYQGILPQCSYPDAWSSAMQYVDYVFLRHYFEDPSRWAPGVAWTPAQTAAVYGHPNPTNPITFTEVIPNSGRANRDCPGVPDEDVYDRESNPDGVRCTLQDYMVNLFGRRPQDGFARRPFDNVGIQYGVEALLEGTLLPSQFVDLNDKVGGADIDGLPQPERSAGDPLALERVYRSGANNTASNLDEVAIIDLRGPDPGAFHDVYRTYALRDRLIREHGDADNQILWRGTVPLLGDLEFTTEGLIAMDAWLASVEADERDVPLSEKIVEDKPDALTHRCTDGATGTDLPSAYCDAVVQAYSTPRMEAGMATTDDTQKCQLVPLEEFDYGGVTFTEAEWTRLEATFPDGVCDYSRPSVGDQDTVPWLTYADGPGGRPLGEPPLSSPFGGGGSEEPPAAPQLSVADLARDEGDGGPTPFVVTITLSGPASEPVSVTYATADRTARAGSDYEASSGVLTFAPGETSQTVTVTVRGEGRDEADETFTVELSHPAGAELADPTGVVTIVDDDARDPVGRR